MLREFQEEIARLREQLQNAGPVRGCVLCQPHPPTERLTPLTTCAFREPPWVLSSRRWWRWRRWWR